MFACDAFIALGGSIVTFKNAVVLQDVALTRLLVEIDAP